jgi:hypothetical protein
VATLLSDDVVAAGTDGPPAEWERLRPITTLSSSPTLETRTSAGAVAVVVAVVAAAVLEGTIKYRPIARRTAAFAVPPISPSNDPGGETGIRWLGIGDCFLYYAPPKKREEELSSSDSVTGNKGEGKWGGDRVGVEYSFWVERKEAEWR